VKRRRQSVHFLDHVGLESERCGALAEIGDDLALATAVANGDAVRAPASQTFQIGIIGDAAEDDSQGHALCHDPATLRRVLRESSAADQRALSAQVLGYVVDKQAMVADLVGAMSDPSETVRNSAMRALVVFTRMAPAATQAVPRIPYDPFIGLLHSLVWTDRNKSSLALMELSEGRDPELLAKLRNEAMQPLVDMARWKNDGQAMPGLLILGRIAGWSDDATRAASGNGQREDVIRAALDAR